MRPTNFRRQQLMRLLTDRRHPTRTHTALHQLSYILYSRVANETYDAKTEIRPSKQRLETIGRDVQSVTIQLQLYNV